MFFMSGGYVMPQVEINHYKWTYLTRQRFLLYQKSIEMLSFIKFSDVLEIGPGPGVLSNILKFLEKNIITLDFDYFLKPDIVADVRELPLKNKSFDLIIANQILEHIPYNNFCEVLSTFADISREYVLISLPYNEHHIEFYFNFKIIKYLYFRGVINKLISKIFPIHFYFGISRFLSSFPEHEEHYWEIGYKEYSLNKVRREFFQHFEIIREERVMLAPYYYIFLLKIRES